MASVGIVRVVVIRVVVAVCRRDDVDDLDVEAQRRTARDDRRGAGLLVVLVDEHAWF